MLIEHHSAKAYCKCQGYKNETKQKMYTSLAFWIYHCGSQNQDSHELPRKHAPPSLNVWLTTNSAFPSGSPTKQRSARFSLTLLGLIPVESDIRSWVPMFISLSFSLKPLSLCLRWGENPSHPHPWVGMGVPHTDNYLQRNFLSQLWSVHSFPSEGR